MAARLAPALLVQEPVNRLISAALLLLVACAPASQGDDADSDEGALGGTGTAGGATVLPNAIHWVRNSAEYQASVRQAYRLAAATVDATVARDHLAAGTWGVVVDADETIVDNSGYNKERAFSAEGSTSSSWDTYVRSKQGKAIGPALAFLDKVRGAGGRVFVVTNRGTDHCPSTEENLRAIGVHYDAILCKGALESDKNGRFKAIEAGRSPSPFPATKVVVYVGDNIQDFPDLGQDAKRDEAKLGEFGGRFVMLPNPMYGSWEKLARD